MRFAKGDCMMHTIVLDNFSYEMSHFVLDNMNHHTDIRQVINLLLEKIANKYQLNHIMIMENKTELGCFRVSYEWAKDKINSSLNHVISYSEHFKIYFMEKMSAGEIITYKEYIDHPTYINIETLFKKRQCNSVISLPYITKDQKSGLILFESKKENYNFTEQEIQSLYHLRNILLNYFFVMRDYQDTKEKMEHISTYDSVTGLFNYETFICRAERMLKKDVEAAKCIIISVDIINFKYFNEYYGYDAGDEVLRLFNHSISIIFNKVLACRVFSDNFVILSKLEPGMTEQRVSRAIDAFNKVFSNKVHELYKETKLEITAGVHLFCNTESGVRKYIDNADKARKSAKLVSKRCEIYNESMDHELKRNIMITNIAEDALLHEEFYFELQPKFNLKNKKLTGAEALVRWRRSDGSMIYPNEFIPIYEQNEFILKLDFYIYAKVCTYIKNRIDQGKSIIPISVNVSRVHLRYEDFVKSVIQLVDFYQIPHHLLEFEITESIFLENIKSARVALVKLKNAGFIVSMDDFGAGFSSLNLLRKLDFDVLKLDKDFLNDGKLQKKDKIVIANIISMAKEMQITVLCEGVETKEQADLLENLGCDLVQGYYFGRPMLIEQFETLYQYMK